MGWQGTKIVRNKKIVVQKLSEGCNVIDDCCSEKQVFIEHETIFFCDLVFFWRYMWHAMLFKQYH